MKPMAVHAHGADIPVIGLGTWPMKGQDCVDAVSHALKVGYRHLDTAAMYGNETEVGRGLRQSGVRREDVFLTTKVWWTDIAEGCLQRSAEASLRALSVAYADLVLIHWPNGDIPLAESIRALCAVKKHGLARHIGVANFPAAMLREAVDLASEPLVANQCEYHPRLDQTAVLEAVRGFNSAFVSYSPLGRGDLLRDPVVTGIAERLGRTPAQIVLRWHIQQPRVCAIPKSADPTRIEENFQVFDFALAEEDMAALSGLARPDGRLIDPEWSPAWDRAA